MNIDGIELHKHAFPEKLKEWRFDPRLLYEGVRDIETWIKNVGKFARRNETDVYTLNLIQGDAFEHLVQCIIERHGHDAEVDSVVVGAPHEGFPALDLLGKTHAGKSHAHQCKFHRGGRDKKSRRLGINDIDSFTKLELESGSLKTLWTTADGINAQVEKIFRDHVRVFGIAWLQEMLDGDDAFWKDTYATKFDATIERRRGLIDDGKLTFSNPDRSYQLEALRTFKKEVAKNPHDLKGRYVYPTSAGKTLIEALITKHQIERTGGFGVHVVVAPRIALLTQLMREFRDYIGDKYGHIGFHSGDQENEGREFDKNLNLLVQRKTTDIEKVLSEISRAREDNYPLIIFSTYHSLHKLVRDKISLETMIADESQYCISKRYFESVQNIKSKVKLYFTATERHAEAGTRRNNNVQAFGDILGTASIKDLVDQNILAEPRLVLVVGKTEATYQKSNKTRGKKIQEEDVIARYLIDLAGHIAENQREKVNDSMPAKTLFACKSAEHIRIILGEENLQNLMTRVKKIDSNRGHTIFTISSRTGAKIDGKKVKRGTFLKTLGEHQKNALVFHHDILSEGIDIDGITGVAMLRNMNHAKKIQTIGRALRPYKKNPSLKPYAYISVPVINGEVLESELLENTIRQMLSVGFDANSEVIDVRFIDRDHPKPAENPKGGKDHESGGGWNPDDGYQAGFDLHQKQLRDVKHQVKILTERIEKEEEEEAHAVMLAQEVTDGFIDDLLSGKYGSEQKPFNEELATYRNRRHIIERVWETGRVRGSELLKTKSGVKSARPLTPMNMIEEHVDRLGDISGHLTLTPNIEYVPYLKEKGANVVLATRSSSDGERAATKEAGTDDVPETRGPCEATRNLAESQVVGVKYLTLEEVMNKGLKFDIVIGNPPYQERKPDKKKPRSIWQDFVLDAIKILDGGGVLSMIHPPGWRGTGRLTPSEIGVAGSKLKSMDMDWISMISQKDCGKFFKGKSTPFDIYVARNSNTPGHMTKIVGTDGIEFKSCIKELKIVPNFQCRDLERVIAKEGEERMAFLYKRSAYGTDKEWVLDIPNKKTNEYKYPCVYSVGEDESQRGKDGGELTLRYSSKIQKDESYKPIFFGTPKVIFSTWHGEGIPYVDRKGKYGMCQDTGAFTGDLADLDTIAKVLEGSRFRRVMEAVKFGTRKWNKHVLRILRKDFWKEFVDEDGNLIDEDGKFIDRKGNLLDAHGNVISGEEDDVSQGALNARRAGGSCHD